MAVDWHGSNIGFWTVSEASFAVTPTTQWIVPGSGGEVTPNVSLEYTEVYGTETREREHQEEGHTVVGLRVGPWGLWGDEWVAHLRRAYYDKATVPATAHFYSQAAQIGRWSSTVGSVTHDTQAVNFIVGDGSVEITHTSITDLIYTDPATEDISTYKEFVFFAKAEAAETYSVDVVFEDSGANTTTLTSISLTQSWKHYRIRLQDVDNASFDATIWKKITFSSIDANMTMYVNGPHWVPNKDDLQSFSGLWAGARGGTSQYKLYNGNKWNTYQLAAELGKPWKYSGEVYCQYKDKSATKVFTKLQSVTVGADAVRPSGGHINYYGTSVGLLYTGDVSLDVVNNRFTTVNVNINNSLERRLAEKTGADTLIYKVAETINPTKLEIGFNGDIWYTSETHEDKFLAGTEMECARINLGNFQIVLHNGKIKGESPPLKMNVGLKLSLDIPFSYLTIYG